jgi:hypothetical protein
MTLPLVCHLILIQQHVTIDYRLFTYNMYYYWHFRSLSVTEELPLHHLTFWHRNLAFKFLHTLYVKCE